MLKTDGKKLIIEDGFGTVWIEAWGKDSVRVRMTKDRFMDKNDWALEDSAGQILKLPSAEIKIDNVDTTYPWAKHFDSETNQIEKTSGQTASLKNGRMLVKVNYENWISFWKIENGKEELLFEEQWRNRWRIDRFCVPTNNAGRELKANPGKFNNKATVRFEAYDDEKIFGMGQY